MKLLLLTVVLGLLALSSAWPMRKQKYSVKVKLMCGNKPDKNVRVKLVEYDTGPDPDDTLASEKTNNQGYVELSGSTRELSNIDPRLVIYTNCNDGIKPCARRWRFDLPKSYINSGVFDAGTINMEMAQLDESRDCIH